MKYYLDDVRATFVYFEYFIFFQFCPTNVEKEGILSFPIIALFGPRGHGFTKF